MLGGDAHCDRAAVWVVQRGPAAFDLEFESAGVVAGAGLDGPDFVQVHDTALRPAPDLEDVTGVDQVRGQSCHVRWPGLGEVEGFPPGAVAVAEPAVGVDA